MERSAYLEFLCKNMRLLRTSRKLTQEKISLELNTARTTYSSYENGWFLPDLYMLDALASFYKIDLETLVMRDITKGTLGRIYLSGKGSESSELINTFHKLSAMSKCLIMQRMQILHERERAFYKIHDDYTIYNDISHRQ
ncbi:MAG: helix-turn-helix transcriptional regulator [Anaerofustis stercorihominis]|nr:helix-turn-helix transcriptional regulator [Anaerofustis stercorihominis]